MGVDWISHRRSVFPVDRAPGAPAGHTALSAGSGLPSDAPVPWPRTPPWRRRAGAEEYTTDRRTRGRKAMNHDNAPAYGLWSLVILNSLVFIIFAFSFTQ